MEDPLDEGLLEDVETDDGDELLLCDDFMNVDEDECDDSL